MDTIQRARCLLTLPDKDVLYAQIRANAPYAKRMAQQHAQKGKTLAICGAGPSLADTAATMEHTDHVWACNSAVNFMHDHGYRMTHGFAIDQGEAMLAPHEWGTTYPMPYYVASSVHPRLVQHLLAHKRKLTFFHSFLGLPDPDDWTPDPRRPDVTYEMTLYTTIYPTSVQVGFGLNSVPRAICLALFLGYSRILVYGADCACTPDAPPMPFLNTPEYAAWIAALPMYADGRCAVQYGDDAVMAEAVIDGTRWHTRPDMVMSAVHMVDMCKQYPQIELIGRTLPNALRHQSAEFMADMPRLGGVGDVLGFGRATPSHVEDAEYVHA